MVGWLEVCVGGRGVVVVEFALGVVGVVVVVFGVVGVVLLVSANWASSCCRRLGGSLPVGHVSI